MPALGAPPEADLPLLGESSGLGTLLPDESVDAPMSPAAPKLLSELPLVPAQRLAGPALSGGTVPTGSASVLVGDRPLQRTVHSPDARPAVPDVQSRDLPAGMDAAPLPTGASPPPARTLRTVPAEVQRSPDLLPVATPPPSASKITGPAVPFVPPAPVLQRSPAPPAAPSAPAVAQPGPALSIQRIEMASAPSGPDLPEPAAPQAPAPPMGLSGTEPITRAAGDVTTQAAAAAPGLATGDLDALAGRLYDKIRYRLKAELRLDRERAGLITDRR